MPYQEKIGSQIAKSHIPADSDKKEKTPKMYRGMRFVFMYLSFSSSVGAEGSTSGGSSLGQ